MSAYFIARVNVTDPEKYKDYTSVTPGVIEKYGGEIHCPGRRDGNTGRAGSDGESCGD